MGLRRILFIADDIDGCDNANDKCDVNAYCTNTAYSYNCTCKEGFAGDGHSCSGRLAFTFCTKRNDDLGEMNWKRLKGLFCVCRLLL